MWKTATVEVRCAWTGISDVEAKPPFILAWNDVSLVVAIPDRVFAQPAERQAFVDRMRALVKATAAKRPRR